MAPTLLLNKEAEELQQLATQIRDYQEAEGLKDSEILRRYHGLGSDKTYRRIRAGDLDELDIERQLANYRAVWQLIEATAGRLTGEADEIYDDLSPAMSLRRVFLEVISENGNARLVLLEGDTGTGKSKALDGLLKKYGQRILPIEASEAWGDSPMAFLGEVLSALGQKHLPTTTMGRLNLLIPLISRGRICLAIDEAHHMGPACLNTLKTLINRTPGEFLLLAMPTLWRRTERGAWEEVRQLTGNRLAERIKLGELRNVDIKKLLTRRCDFTDPRFVKALAEKAPLYGNLAFVRDVATRIAKAVTGGSANSIETAVEAMQAEIASR
jgi:hypothetical protein